MKKIYTPLKSAQGSIGHTKQGVSATGGYAKFGQLGLNGLVHTLLFVKKVGVVGDAAIGDVRTVKQVWVDTEQNNLKAYKDDLKDLRKALKKAKKKDRKELKADIKQTEEVIKYYTSQVAKARKL